MNIPVLLTGMFLFSFFIVIRVLGNPSILPTIFILTFMVIVLIISLVVGVRNGIIAKSWSLTISNLIVHLLCITFITALTFLFLVGMVLLDKSNTGGIIIG